MTDSVAFPDYFSILGVTQNDLENPPKLRRAYAIAARKIHPDINPSLDANEQFSILSEAYKTLSDKQLRIAYLSELTRQNLTYGIEDGYSNILEGQTIHLPNVGVGLSGIAIKDLLIALTMVYDLDPEKMDKDLYMNFVKRWISRRSHTWTLELSEHDPGYVYIMISPCNFKDYHRLREGTFLKERDFNNPLGNVYGKPTPIEPGTLIPLKHFLQGEIENMELGNIPTTRWDSIILATEILASYQAGFNPNRNWQQIAKNVLDSAYMEYRYSQVFDEITIERANISREAKNSPLLLEGDL